MEYQKKFKACSFIFLQAVYELSGPVWKSLWRYISFLHASLLNFMFCDSFEKLYFLRDPMIVTPYCHILYNKIIKCCILHGDPFQYMHNWWGGHSSRMRSMKIWSLQRTFST